jgi:hypothetical protein
MTVQFTRHVMNNYLSLNTEAAGSSKTLVCIYQIMRCCIQKTVIITIVVCIIFISIKF